MEEYKLLGCIGEGAHGVVFRASHIPTGEIVALKKVRGVCGPGWSRFVVKELICIVVTFVQLL